MKPTGHRRRTIRSSLKTPRLLRDDDQSSRRQRSQYFQYVTVAIFLFLIAGFWDLQVRNPDVYSEAAERNSDQIPPAACAARQNPGPRRPRDRRQPSLLQLILSRGNLKTEHLQADRRRPESGLRRSDRAPPPLSQDEPKYEPIIIKEELTPAELAFVESHRDPGTFPEMELIHAQRRLYPHDGFAAHVIGYVGEVSENELNTPEFIKYEQGDVVGKQGIERQYNDLLMGVDGQRQVVVDNRGSERNVIGHEGGGPGQESPTHPRS